jgi:asparagine synthase (glutamine-hydrolysing)
MCGITGFLWRSGGAAAQDPEAIVGRMAEAIAHRGPDSSGTWVDREAGVALGHRRLAILDLSEAGHQPMVSPSGRYVLSYNGEVYDHADLRGSLEAEDRAPAWRGTSDTETLVAAFDAWGVRKTLSRATGMWAFALWDRQARQLTLARDRLGEKPLYYGWQGAGRDAAFVFASELRALRRHPAVTGAIAQEEIVHFLRHGYVREGQSILRGVQQVRPGEVVTLAEDAREPECARYWDGAEIAARAKEAPFADDEIAAVDRLEELLASAVARQAVADVPLGAFLSGGIDSTTVVALMQRRAQRPVHTFSIGFQEARYDEAMHARAIAAHLGTEHTELYVGSDELLGLVPRLPEIWDEPFGDSSQIPSFLVAQLARAHVTVALSGDGGDELFGGYDRYGQGAALLSRMARIPVSVRRRAAAGLCAVPVGALDRMLAPLRRVPQGKEPNGQWAHRIAGYVGSAGVDELHRRLVSKTPAAEQLAAETDEPPYELRGAAPRRGQLTDAERMMQLDMVTYLPGDILTKVDRSSMAVSLECRAPLLDHRIAEFAWSLPLAMKRSPGGSKWVLRRLLHRLVPERLVERPKMGFEVPIGLWLRGPLRDWAEALLARERLARAGCLDPDAVRAMWEQHMSGRFNHGAGLWHVLMLEAWRERWSG